MVQYSNLFLSRKPPFKHNLNLPGVYLVSGDLVVFRQSYVEPQLRRRIIVYAKLVYLHQVRMQYGQQFVHVRALDVRRQPFDVITWQYAADRFVDFFASVAGRNDYRQVQFVTDRL